MSNELSLSNFSISSFMDHAHEHESYDAETPVIVKFLFLPSDVGCTDSACVIMELQKGLNQYKNVKTLNIDGVYGPLTEEALHTAGFTSPLSLADFNEIVAPASHTVSSSDNTGKASKTSDQPKMSWMPFGVSFSRNTASQKALVWGIWLIMAAIVVWGAIVLFGEKESKHSHA